MSPEEINLTKREIEILKLCQHPNIIRLLDVFENPDYIYIVIELLKGGDLYEYMSKRNFKISEARARSIIHALATALYYIHSFGIVHRDIKLDNALLVDNSDDSDVKLVDFGLSKIIGPGEFCHEPYGTYGFAAPEILMEKPYGPPVDIWSLGVILYALLSGSLPFDSSAEEKVAWYFVCLNNFIRNTVHQEPIFTGGPWAVVSKEAKDCVMSIFILYLINNRNAFKRPSKKDNFTAIIKASLANCKLQRSSRNERTFSIN